MKLSEWDLKIQSQKRSKNKHAATSYDWGDSSDRAEVTCNRHVVHDTQNLADALRLFRHPWTIRRLWADVVEVKDHSIHIPIPAAVNW